MTQRQKHYDRQKNKQRERKMIRYEKNYTPRDIVERNTHRGSGKR